ncbi:unnamed protein product [Arctia plantaginis]|uniref:Uncharacterized protein n=1 Tax=Arctia plantaginis TaxID=874455 RepID=A0A8S0ZM46_ARCPL|nr:unnamed protein product [Arctia plantaginis]
MLINNINLWAGRDAPNPPEKKMEVAGSRLVGNTTEEALARLSLSQGLSGTQMDILRSTGALEAIAAAHNQEMHTLNGNINFSVVHDTARADVMAAALTRATRGVRHRHAIRVETERRLRVAQEEVPMLVYTSNVANGVGLVAGLDRNREPEGVLAQPVGEMLSACLDRVLRSPTPLKVTMEQWLSTRMTAPNVDWALIDELVAWLTMRFIPQPEIYHDEAGGSETHWLPRAYCDVAYATHEFPDCVTPDDESSFYYHDHATTFTDNVFVSKTLANMALALRVGAWTNEAELITGLGIATYIHSERGATVGKEGTAMALDDIKRAMLKRSLFEEWKRGVGIGDHAVSPDLMGNDRAFWDTIVYGAGEESDAVSAIALQSVKKRQKWLENEKVAVTKGAFKY